MIDVHCHIIPNIDDGSKGEEQSLNQLLAMDSGGISHAFLTSHCFRGHYDYSREEYDTKLSALQEKLQEAGAKIKLLPGFEVYLQPNSLEDIQKFNLCMGDSNYVLIESDLNGLPEDFYNNIFPLLRAGYKPILAHAERYVSIMKSISSAKKLVERNMYIQVNSGSLMGQYGTKVQDTRRLVNMARHICWDLMIMWQLSLLFDAPAAVRIDRRPHCTAAHRKPSKVLETAHPASLCICHHTLAATGGLHTEKRSLWQKLRV